MEQDINRNNQFTEEEGGGFDYKEWLFHFLRFWYIYIIALGLAYGYAWYQNRAWIPVFSSSGTMILETDGRGGGGGRANFMQGFGVQAGFSLQANQLIMLRSYDFIGRVVDELPFMQVEYRTRGRFRERNLYRNTPIIITTQHIAPKAFGQMFRIAVTHEGQYSVSLTNGNGYIIMTADGILGEWLETGWFTIKVQRVNENYRNFGMYFRFRDRSSLVREFMGRLHLGMVADRSSILRVSLQSDTPDRDIDFINKLSEVFIADNLALKNDVAERTISFIDQQLVLLETEMNRAASDLAAFREDNQLVNLSVHTSNIISRQNALENQQISIETRSLFLDYLVNFLDDNLASGEMIVPPPVVATSNPQLLALTDQLSAQNLFLAEINERHILYDRTIREINTIKARIRLEIIAMRQSLRFEEELLNRRMADLHEELRELPRRELDIAALERRFRIEESYYTFFLQRRAEAEVQKASNRPDHAVLDRARNMGMINGGERGARTRNFLMIGLVLSGGFVLLLKLLNTKANTVSDIEKVSAFPVIGSVRRTKKKNPMLLIKHPRSSFAETFRVIRTRLEFIVQRKSNIMIAVSSAESGDGKTYFSVNLAAVYAVTGKKTLLVDMDIRKPNMHDYFNTSNEPGITNYLIGDMTLKEVIKKTENENYDLLTTGTIPPNPGEMIRSENLKKMFEELRKEYDYIIIDTSPIGLVADAYAISLLADINLFVARLGKTHKEGIQKITEQLREDKVQNIYTIINDVSAQNHSYSKYNSYYGSTYGYGYGYGAKFYSKKKREAAKNFAKYYSDDEKI